MRNCEDAYGFPPYDAIEGPLRRRNGTDLKEVERTIVARALRDVPAMVIRSENMDWWRRLPEVVDAWTLAASLDGATPGAPPALIGGNGGAERGLAADA
jgi:hypothetical protein